MQSANLNIQVLTVTIWCSKKYCAVTMAMSRRQRPHYSEIDVFQPSPLKREDRITLLSVFEAISDGGMFEETKQTLNQIFILMVFQVNHLGCMYLLEDTNAILSELDVYIESSVTIIATITL